MQKDKEGKLHPVAFSSKTLVPAEQNYDIYDKELLALVWALLEWRAYLEGNPHIIEVTTDHKNLEWFLKTKELTRRQARGPKNWRDSTSLSNTNLEYTIGQMLSHDSRVSTLKEGVKALWQSSTLTTSNQLQ